IDFAANAASLGAQVLRADTPAELEEALATAAGMGGGPVVIVVEVDPEPSVPDYDSWWDVPVAEVSTSPRVQAARRDYEAKLARERSFV
ncbi:MAG TPA: thiamine pyrophosphate-dependent enzyme, partial [Candidatus Limnocylindrales bacterium]|nr:thiamine pyrophosphate-dependent enzyme [Candidatus Limnocylindrales bacterium]